jgi:hypothetical protein
MSLSWNSADFQQTQDRIYRIINEKDVNIKIFVYDKTLDMKRLRMALNREKLNQGVHKNTVLTKEEYKKLFEGIR